jgi:iron(III) transport system permease protein
MATTTVTTTPKAIGRGRVAWGRGLVRGIALAALAAFLLTPLIAILGEPLGELGRVIDEARSSPEFGAALRNTFLLAIGSVAITVVVATALAFCTARLPPGRYSTVASLIAVVPLAMPTVAAVIGWIFLFTPSIGYANVAIRDLMGSDARDGPFNVYSLPAIILVTAVHLVPFVYLFVLNALRNLDVGLEDAARVCGASWWRVQWSVILRGIRPALLYGTVIVVLLGLGQFTTPLFLGGNQIQVLATLMFRETQAIPPDYSYASFLAVPLVLTALALVFVQRRIVGDLRRYATAGKGVGRVRRRRRWPIIPVVGFGLLTVVPPLVGLLIVGMSSFWTANVSWDSLSPSRIWESLSEPQVSQSLFNTLRFAAVSVALVLVLSLAVGLFLNRSRSRLKGALDYLINLPLSIPALIFGMGIFVAYALGPPKLYGSPILFIVAYVTLTLPHGVRIVTGGLAQVGSAPQAAARVSGAGPVRSMSSILLPLLRGSLAGAGILAFVIMIQEFSAASLLRSSGTQVMSTLLYERFEFSGYPQVAAIAVAMVGISLVGVLVLLAIGGRKALDQ